ncbi:AAA family ATPase [Acerihabitans sp. KWT182]|uniref:AAA family ATPase n=1 Tax=Acerihabitans sp. KWT182 TaxID=3157919 RepID=A0AAU7Q8R2_9GAMM
MSIEAKGVIDGRRPIVWSREIIRHKTTLKGARALSNIAARKLEHSRRPKAERGAGKEVIFPLISYYGTGRLWAENEEIGYQKQAEGITKAYTHCLSAKSSSRDFLSWYKTQDDNIRRFGDPLDIIHLNALKAVILKLMPDKRWVDTEFDYKLNTLVGTYSDRNGRKYRLAYNQLSDGLRNIIGIAADMAYRCIQLNPHLGGNVVVDTPGVVLIDEIDLHLHPVWQKSIIQDFKDAFPKLQFIATTHSPFIVQSLGEGELINVDRPGSDAVPNILPLNKVATQVMGIENIRSDNFELRVQSAREKLAKINADGRKLTLDDYLKIRQVVNASLFNETDDPEYKAYLLAKDQGDSYETR